MSRMQDSLKAGMVANGYDISGTEKELSREERLAQVYENTNKQLKERAALERELDKAAEKRLATAKLEAKQQENIKKYQDKGYSVTEATQKAQADYDKDFKAWEKNIKKKYELLAKLDDQRIKKNAKLERDAQAREATDLLKNGHFLQAIRAASVVRNANGDVVGTSGGQFAKTLANQLSNTVANALKGFSNYAAQLNGDINSIAGMKTIVDTRLQGATTNWTTLNSNVTKNVGMNPFVKQADINNNLAAMVKSGIAYNVEQRAFLQTIKDKIADTFDANNGVLLRLIRIQSKDSTAARLGMESALTTYLNKMYENTEYLTNVSTTVKSNLDEAMSLMGAEDSVAFEYQIQKWLGSLYSKGASDVSGLSSAIGQLASGNISSLTGSGTGNLLIMAANKAGLSLSDLLANGLTGNSANSLMSAMVSYMGGLYNQAGGNKLLQNQLANVYGLKASDLLAASKLNTGSIYGSSLSYNDALSQLGFMGSTLSQRVSYGQMLENLKGNMNYSLASGIANNPVLYSIYTIANLVDSVAGGGKFSIPLVMGSGSSQTFSVSEIMKMGALGTSAYGGMADMLGGLGKSGLDLMNSFGISTSSDNYRGITSTGTSESGYVGNANGGDVYNSTMTGQTDETNSQVASAQENSTETTLSTVDQSVQSIYTLLNNLVENNCLRVVTTNYGV